MTPVLFCLKKLFTAKNRLFQPIFKDIVLSSGLIFKPFS